MPKVRCAICGREFLSEDSPGLPFCSVRCKRIDLNRWLGEGYGLPIEREEDEPGPPASERDDPA